MRRNEKKGITWLKKLNRWNFDKITRVQIVYEDCDHCGARAKCPDIQKMKLDLAAVKVFTRMFKRHKVPVTLYKKNSGNHTKSLLKSMVPGIPLPLDMLMQLDDSGLYMMAMPHYNYFIVRYQDKTQRLFTINVSVEKAKVEAVSCPMYQ